MKTLSTLISGLVFGIGLILSGMINPLKVQNFLDLFGTWDPSLAFVMGGAIIVTMPGFWLVQKRTKPFFNDKFYIPKAKDFDTRLMFGAGIFGVGWGLGGLCPGPALTSISISNNPCSPSNIISNGTPSHCSILLEVAVIKGKGCIVISTLQSFIKIGVVVQLFPSVIEVIETVTGLMLTS